MMDEQVLPESLMQTARERVGHQWHERMIAHLAASLDDDLHGGTGSMRLPFDEREAAQLTHSAVDAAVATTSLLRDDLTFAKQMLLEAATALKNRGDFATGTKTIRAYHRLHEALGS